MVTLRSKWLIFWAAVWSPLIYAATISGTPSCEKILATLVAHQETVPIQMLLPPQAFVRPSDPTVFHDPADTATFVGAIQVLSNGNSTILNLGTGGGADSFQAANTAAFVMGVDTSATAIASASSTYARDNLHFNQFDYFTHGPVELMRLWPSDKLPPSILASNPPYVPCVSSATCPSPTMYGGPDGIRFVREVINYGAVLKIPKIALTIGSYSSPREVVAYLKDHGYSPVHVTLTPVAFGAYSKANLEHIKRLESEGRAILWRPDESNEPTGYFMVGISAIDESQITYHGKRFTGQSLVDTLRSLAQLSKSQIYDNPRVLSDLPVKVIKTE